jgi:hypothetical protein
MATVKLLRTVLTAASPATIVCASADLFRVPGCPKATGLGHHTKSVCLSSSRSRAAFNPTTAASGRRCHHVSWCMQDQQTELRG